VTDFKHVEEQIARSRELERAYSTDFFGPVEGDPMKKTGEYASKENRSLIARNSAAMGRFLYEAHIGPLLDTMQALLDENEHKERLLGQVWNIARDNHLEYRARIESIMAAIREKPVAKLTEKRDDTTDVG